MIFTAPYVMLLMRADTLRGQVEGGWALESGNRYFFGPCEPLREGHLGPRQMKTIAYKRKVNSLVVLRQRKESIKYEAYEKWRKTHAK